MSLDNSTIGVIGAGTMGSGIAQIASQNGHAVVLIDSNEKTLNELNENLKKVLNRLIEKGRINEAESNKIIENITYTTDLELIKSSDMVIEAIIEDLNIKHSLFKSIEAIVSDKCIIASNTSSLSIASLGASLKKPNRVIGVHFFNPAPLMPLVEIIPAVQTDQSTLSKIQGLIKKWNKVGVLCKDTPGFIVNRVARPFYGEALRIYEEGIADFATIDWAIKELGGFKMGPFELMDYIGNDINYTVTETVFKAFYYDTRYKPSFTQKRMMEAGYLGRKSERGYYDYSIDMPKPIKNRELGKRILWRILSMLINEAADALFLNIATKEDIDLAMTKGVNYPKGLLLWADEIGINNVLNVLKDLQEEYGEDRYRPSPLLRRMVKENKSFY